MKIALQIQACTCLRSKGEGTIKPGRGVMNVSSRRGVFDSGPKKFIVLTLNAGKEVYILMPWAMESKLGERPILLQGRLIQRVEWSPRPPQYLGDVLAYFFFMPTCLSRHFGQEKRMSMLKLCLFQAQLSTNNGKFRLGSFLMGRCESFGTLAIERVPGPSLFELRCFGLRGKHLKMTKERLKNVP